MEFADSNLVWIDLEMTGLDPDTDRVIEIATIVTDRHLTEHVDGPSLAIHQPDTALDAMDEWNTRHHGDSGLTERVRASTTTIVMAEAATLEFLAQWVPPGISPMCGNSVGQDRRFIYRYMPKLSDFFHYRNIDVSTLKELAKSWAPSIAPFAKKGAHLAMDDIRESIEELRYYRKHFLRIDSEPTD